MSEAKRVFFSDLKFPNMYYAALVRSPVQRGRLVEIRPLDLPEGYFLFTATDIPGKNSIEINGGSMPMLAEGNVSYIGEPVGIVAGPDHETAATLAEKAEVIVEANAEEAELPRVERLVQRGDVSLFFEDEDGAPDESESENQDNDESEVSGEEIHAGAKKSGDETEGNPQEEALADSDSAESPDDSDAPPSSPDAIEIDAEEDDTLIITESSAEIALSEYLYAEHSGATVKYKKDRLEIYAATRWPFYVKKSVSAVLSLSPEKIAVIPTDVAANTEDKMFGPSLAAAQAALAAFLCKKPVKLIFSRSDELQYSPKSPPVKIKIKSAAAPSGKIKAMQADIEINPGSRTPFINEITERMTAASRSFYAIENCKTSVSFATSNLPPMIPPSGFGESEAFLALEAHMDILSRQLNVLPQDIRQANIADAKYSFILKTICEAADFDRKYTAYENFNRRRGSIKDGPVRGIGLSLGYQGSGFLSSWHEGVQYSAEITMETTGEVHIKCGSYSSSIKEIICSLASELLGIDKSLISFVESSPNDATFSGPDILSSSIAIIAPLVSKCCSSIQRQRFRKPLPITVKKTYKPAKPSAKEEDGNSAQEDSSFVSFTPGACIAELELNPLDFSIKTRGLWIACDAGKLLSQQNAEKTLKRTAKESLAKLTAETIKIEDGRFCATSHFGSSIPAFLPELDLEIFFIDSKEMPCGLGTIAYNLLRGAYCAAIAQITQSTEIKVPVTTRYLYSCLRATPDGDN